MDQRIYLFIQFWITQKKWKDLNIRVELKILRVKKNRNLNGTRSKTQRHQIIIGIVKQSKYCDNFITIDFVLTEFN